MSIIHDALKKVQQGLNHKAIEKPAEPIVTAPVIKTESSSNNPFAAPPKEPETPVENQTIEYIAPSPNNFKSILALICAVVITLGTFMFLYKQLDVIIFKAKKAAKTAFYKIINKEEVPDFKTKAPEDLVPLAKITVNQPNSNSTPSHSSSAGTPTVSTTINPNSPVTLNIHGVMSDGGSNVVLINNQVYQEGDDVDGVKIIKINLKSITVINNGKEERISVNN